MNIIKIIACLWMVVACGCAEYLIRSLRDEGLAAIKIIARQRLIINLAEFSHVPANAWDAAVIGGIVQRTAVPDVYFSRIFEGNHEPYL